VEEDLLSLPGIKPYCLGRPARSLVAIPGELSRLLRAVVSRSYVMEPLSLAKMSTPLPLLDVVSVHKEQVIQFIIS
jgi:hypothetical protein